MVEGPVGVGLSSGNSLYIAIPVFLSTWNNLCVSKTKTVIDSPTKNMDVIAYICKEYARTVAFLDLIKDLM